MSIKGNNQSMEVDIRILTEFQSELDETLEVERMDIGEVKTFSTSCGRRFMIVRLTDTTKGEAQPYCHKCYRANIPPNEICPDCQRCKPGCCQCSDVLDSGELKGEVEND